MEKGNGRGREIEEIWERERERGGVRGRDMA